MLWSNQSKKLCRYLCLVKLSSPFLPPWVCRYLCFVKPLSPFTIHHGRICLSFSSSWSHYPFCNPTWPYLFVVLRFAKPLPPFVIQHGCICLSLSLLCEATIPFYNPIWPYLFGWIEWNRITNLTKSCVCFAKMKEISYPMELRLPNLVLIYPMFPNHTCTHARMISNPTIYSSEIGYHLDNFISVICFLKQPLPFYNFILKIKNFEKIILNNKNYKVKKKK